MNFRRFLMFAFAVLMFSGASVSPMFTVASPVAVEQVQLADGGFPMPEECGLYDICRVADNS